MTRHPYYPSPIGHSQISVIGPPTDVGDRRARGLCSKLMRKTELKVLQ